MDILILILCAIGAGLCIGWIVMQAINHGLDRQKARHTEEIARLRALRGDFPPVDYPSFEDGDDIERYRGYSTFRGF